MKVMEWEDVVLLVRRLRCVGSTPPLDLEPELSPSGAAATR